jgi:hypothetical protein
MEIQDQDLFDQLMKEALEGYTEEETQQEEACEILFDKFAYKLNTLNSDPLPIPPIKRQPFAIYTP